MSSGEWSVDTKSLYIRCIYFVNMVIGLVTFKIEKNFLNEVDSISKESGFGNRTEFIRTALREKMDEIKLKEAMIRLSKLKGKSTKNISNEQIHIVREKVLNDLMQKKGFK